MFILEFKQYTYQQQLLDTGYFHGPICEPDMDKFGVWVDKYFYYPDKYIYDPMNPPLYLEEQTDIYLGTKWNYPFNWGWKKTDIINGCLAVVIWDRGDNVSDELRKLAIKIQYIIYNTLLDLNPELKKLKFNSSETKTANIVYVCAGVSSGFNFNDIQYFLSDPHVSDEKNRHSDRVNTLLRKYKIDMFAVQWVLDNSTIDRLEKELSIKY